MKALLDTPAASVLNRFIAFVASATGFARFDAGEIDAFGLDDLIHHYKRSARELWKFCGSSGSDWERAASALAYWQEQGDEPDWWQAGDTRGRRG